MSASGCGWGTFVQSQTIDTAITRPKPITEKVGDIYLTYYKDDDYLSCETLSDDGWTNLDKEQAERLYRFLGQWLEKS